MARMLGAIALLLWLTCRRCGRIRSRRRSRGLPGRRSATESVLKQQGWDIEKSDQAAGWINTESRSVNGEDYGVYAKGARHRLAIRLTAAGPNRTTVTVERSLFNRERIWIDKDEPLMTTDQTVGEAVLAAMGRHLTAWLWAALAVPVAAPFLLAGLGGAPFDDPGEGMHAEIARELARPGTRWR